MRVLLHLSSISRDLGENEFSTKNNELYGYLRIVAAYVLASSADIDWARPPARYGLPGTSLTSNAESKMNGNHAR